MKNITFEVGTDLMSGEDFIIALGKGKFLIGKKAKDALLEPTFRVTNKKRTVQLVLIYTQELGLGKNVRIEEIYERAKKVGLEPCADEIAPLFRLKYRKQPKGELLIVATTPPIDLDGNLKLFEIIHTESGEQWITILGGNHKNEFKSDVLWVFTKK